VIRRLSGNFEARPSPDGLSSYSFLIRLLRAVPVSRAAATQVARLAAKGGAEGARAVTELKGAASRTICLSDMVQGRQS
jgi:hypothetical protein